MKIVHICDGTPGANTSGGGQVFYWQNLAAMTDLGHEVHLVACNPRHEARDDVTSRVASVSYAVTVPPSRRSLDFLIARVFRHETLPFRFREWGGLQAQALAAIDRLKPDLIWADHMQSLLIAPREYSIVYGHLDFLYQLQPVRRAAHKGRIRRPDVISTAKIKTTEQEACRKARFAVSVSLTDLAVFEELGVPAIYMPVTGQWVPDPGAVPQGPVRAFMFGRPNTAMNMQRRNLRDDIWPHLKPNNPNIEWHMVGDAPAKKDDTWQWVERNFKTHGFVENLGTVFRPGDLCIVPYRDDTGFRAKFVTAAGHGLVNVGYDESFQCAREFIPGENCLAAPSGAEFARRIEEYAASRGMRNRLAAASRQLYEDKFTLKAHLPTYADVLRRGVAREGT